VLLEQIEGGSHPATGQAPAKREEPSRELMGFAPDIARGGAVHRAPTRNVRPFRASGSRRASSQTAAATSSGLRLVPSS